MAREFERARQPVKQLQGDVERLLRSIGGIGGAVVGQVAGARPGQQAGGPQPISLSRQALESRQFFQAIATSSRTALSTMTQALRTESTAQQQHLGRLRKEVDSLAASYAHLESLRRSGVQLANPNAPMEVRQHLWERMQQMGDADLTGQSMRRRQLEMVSQMGGPGKWSARGEMLRDDARSFIENKGAAVFGPGVMQYGGAAIIGAVIAKTLVNTLKSGMQESAQAPYDTLGRIATQSGYGRASVQVRGGDLSLIAAYQMVQGNEQLRKDFAALAQGNGMGAPSPSRGTTGGFAFDQEGWRRSKAAWEAGKRAFWFDPAGGVNQGMRDVGNINPEMTAEQLRFLERFRESRPQDFAAQYHFQQNAGRDIGYMRGLAMGQDRWREYAPDDVRHQFGDHGERANAAVRLMRSFGNRAIDPGTVLSAFGGIEGVAGLGAAQRNVGRGVQGMIGHLPGAPSIVGHAALVGQAAPFWEALTNMVGRGSGGVDVGAAGTIGQIVSGSLTSGAAPTSGQGLLGAFGAYGRGADGAGDMLNARSMGQGLGGIGRITSGGLDPYQRGVNILSAIRSAPGASIGAQEYLATLDPRVIADVVGTGQVPPQLQVRGITAEMVRAHWRTITARTYDRQIGMSPNQGGVADAVQRQSQAVQQRFGGDFRAYVQSLRPEDRERAFVERGAFLRDTGQAQTDLEAEGFARLEAGFGSVARRGRVAGRGVGDSAAGSDQVELERFKSQEEGKLEQKVERMSPELRAQIGFGTEFASFLQGTANTIGVEAKEVAQSLRELNAAIQDATRGIRASAGGGGMGPRR